MLRHLKQEVLEIDTVLSSLQKIRARAQLHNNFNKDIILLPDPSWGIVCKQGARLRLHKHGHILSAFEFQKAWDHQTVVERIRDGFGEDIPEDVSIQLLMACGNKLVSPMILEGQELNGMLIHKVYRTKVLYVRPSRNLLTDSDEENELSHVTTSPTSSMRANAEDSDDDVPVVVGPQIHTGMRSHGTTRAGTSFSIHTNSHRDSNPTSSDFENSSGPNHAASSAVMRPRAMEGSDGNRGNSGLDEDYSSYLSLVATFPDDSSDDEVLNQAIIASMVSQM
ncbi:unnamed protein product [Gadus morhua 'NCC']